MLRRLSWSQGMARLVVVTVGLTMLVLSGRLVHRAYRPEPAVDASAVVTVLSVNGGYSGRFGGTFAHRVRLDSGPRRR
jgi:hypothetical protein